MFATPVVSLIVGLILLAKKRYLPIGIALCIPIIVFFATINSVEYYGFVVMPFSNFCSGTMMVIVGIIEIRRRKEQFKSFIPMAFIIVGLFSALAFPVVMTITSDIYEKNEQKDYAEFSKNYPLTAAFNENGLDKLIEELAKTDNLNEIYEGSSILQGTLLYKATWLIERQELYEKTALLLQAGYDVNETYKNGETLLMLVSVDARWDDDILDKYDLPAKLTALFIEYGADVNATDYEGKTALMWACSYKGYYFEYDIDEYNSPLIPDYFEYYNMTKLTPSFYYNQIKALIDAGADLTIKDKKGYTALDYFNFAIKLNDTETDFFDDDPYYYENKAYYKSFQYKRLCTDILELLEQ